MDLIEFIKQLMKKKVIVAPRMASNTPVNALVVFDGWMGGAGGVSRDIIFKICRELKKEEVYSVAEIVEVDGRKMVILNEVSGKWDMSFFAAYK